MGIPLKVLFVEDNEDHAVLAQRLLIKEGYDLTCERVDNAIDMQSELLKDWDIIISDYSMPGFSGDEALQIYRQSGLDIPFILVSGTLGEENAVRMLKAGAHDFIIKDRLMLIIPAIQRELKEFATRKANKKFETDLQIAQAIVNQSPVVMWQWGLDDDAGVIYVSANVRIFGYEPEDFIQGKLKYPQIIHPDDFILTRNLRDSFLRDETDTYTMEYRIICKDKSQRWVVDHSTLIRNENGQAVMIQGLVLDINERKRIHEAWQDSEERFHTVFDNTPIGIDLVSLEGKILEVNHAFTELMGYTSAELEQMTFMEITHPEDLHLSDDAMQKLISGQAKTVKFEKRYVRKDGKIIWVKLASSMVTNDKGEPQYLIVQTEDVTHSRRMAIEVLEAKEKAEESDRLKSALLTNMSHELRTPMNGVLGFTELIISASTSSEVKDMAKLIDMSGKRLMQTLDSIMLLAQLQSGTKPTDFSQSTVDISAEMTKIAHDYQQDAQTKGLQLLTDIDDKILCESEAKLLRQAIAKLMDNAIKFTHSGSVTLSCKTEQMDASAFVIIKISDTGIGIAESKKNDIFKEFRQVSEGYDRSYEGSGIGLSIAKRIIDLFGGKITVKSTLGEGSTFTVIIPTHAVHETPVEQHADAAKTQTPNSVPPQDRHPAPPAEQHTTVEQHADAAKTQSPNSVPPQDRHPAPTAEQQATTPHSPRILIVEDNMINTKLLFHFISEYCPMIDCASTGEFAVELAKTHAFDAILMDINLGSGIDGLQATKLIRKLPGYAETPIVAVTGYTMIGDKERLLAGGCSHYVGKPFTYDTIIGVLRDILPESISATGY